MTAEEYINKAAGTNEIIAALARELSGTKVPEFSSEPMTVDDVSHLTGIPSASVRAGIIYGWLPIGKAVRNDREVTGPLPSGARTNFIIFPRQVWELTGHVWRGKGK